VTRTFGVILDLARRYRLSAYDAAYLELALRTQSPLASIDRALCSAAASAGVVLAG
jgi:predicted nucleic acid-binding protein